jgi:hypothetical protein
MRQVECRRWNRQLQEGEEVEEAEKKRWWRNEGTKGSCQA